MTPAGLLALFYAFFGACGAEAAIRHARLGQHASAQRYVWRATKSLLIGTCFLAIAQVQP